MWLKKAQHAGFTNPVVRHRHPMTVERLMYYPVYSEGHLDTLLARVAPGERDHLVMSALITAQAGEVPEPVQEENICLL